jgi:hypothetical protein
MTGQLAFVMRKSDARFYSKENRGLFDLQEYRYKSYISQTIPGVAKFKTPPKTLLHLTLIRGRST